MPVIGFLHPASPDAFPERVRGLRQGLKETGFIEGENVGIEYRWAENQIGPVAGVSSRTGSPPRCGDRHNRNWRTRREGSNHSNPHRLRL